MRRKHMGEDFRKSLYTYLERFKYQTTEKDDLCQIMKGKIKMDRDKIKMDITQEQQEGDPFIF